MTCCKWREVIYAVAYFSIVGGGATGFYFWGASCPPSSIALKCWREGNYTDGSACYIDKLGVYGKQVWCTMRVENGATFMSRRGTCVQDDEEQKELAAQDLCGRMHVCYWNPQENVFITQPSEKRFYCVANVIGLSILFAATVVLFGAIVLVACVCTPWYERWKDYRKQSNSQVKTPPLKKKKNSRAINRALPHPPEHPPPSTFSTPSTSSPPWYDNTEAYA